MRSVTADDYSARWSSLASGTEQSLSHLAHSVVSARRWRPNILPEYSYSASPCSPVLVSYPVRADLVVFLRSCGPARGSCSDEVGNLCILTRYAVGTQRSLVPGSCGKAIYFVAAWVEQINCPIRGNRQAGPVCRPRSASDRIPYIAAGGRQDGRGPLDLHFCFESSCHGDTRAAFGFTPPLQLPTQSSFLVLQKRISF